MSLFFFLYVSINYFLVLLKLGPRLLPLSDRPECLWFAPLISLGEIPKVALFAPPQQQQPTEHMTHSVNI